MLTREFDQTKLADRLEAKAVELRRPLTCTLELTYRCSFHCSMCHVRMTEEQAAPYGRMLTVAEWLGLARQLKEAGVLFLNLTGGECTQYPGFLELYAALYQMGFRINVVTNAGAYSDALREMFREYPPHGVTVTLYGGSNETYRKVTGDPKGLDKVLENLRFFQSIGVELGLVFIAIRQNVLDYPQVAEICQQFGKDCVLMMDLTAHSRNVSYSNALACRLSPAEQVCVSCRPAAEVEQALQDAKELEKELVNFVPPMAKEGTAEAFNQCVGSCAGAAILWNGDMQTCVNMVGGPTYKPFEIGFEAAWQQIQADWKRTFRMPAACASCEMAADCPRHCAGRNMESTGDPQVNDPTVCEYVWLWKKYQAAHGLDQKPLRRTCL